MWVMDVKEELLKRYEFLFENRELILANCIIYDIEKDFLKSKIKELKSYGRKLKNNEENKASIELFNGIISSYEQSLVTPKPYLSSKTSKEYLEGLEEFILGDNPMEDTRLYCYIEKLKNNSEALTKARIMIYDLLEKRRKDILLSKIPPFTVWRILSYVRKKYPRNATVLYALDKYYNLDRYIIANDDCLTGYYVNYVDDNLSYNYPSRHILMNPFLYKGRDNEFEEEDDYHQEIDFLEFKSNSYPTKFANDLVELEYISSKGRVEVLKKIKSLTTISK
jgi:hypothetical protein